MVKPIKNPVDDVICTIATTIEKWKSENPPQVIEKKVRELLDKNSKEITLKLLGFDSRYGRDWELDHCNGRSGNSSAGDYIKAQQAEVINQWLSQVTLPDLPTALKENIASQATDTYQREFREKVANLVKQKAAKDAAELFAQLSDPTNQDNYIKALKLIHPET